MEVLVVRHGQSVADIERRLEGRADFPLTELGCKQAEKVAKWISEKYRQDIILSSPLKRAAKTAEYIGTETGIKVIYHEELMEWNNGLLAGLLFSEAKEKYPLSEGGRKPHDEFAECESLINFRARAEMFWSKIVHQYKEEQSIKRICIISHGGMINMLFKSFMNLSINTNCEIRTGDTGLHLWEVDGEKRTIIFSNSQEHLLENY